MNCKQRPKCPVYLFDLERDVGHFSHVEIGNVGNEAFEGPFGENEAWRYGARETGILASTRTRTSPMVKKR